jgi:hypothetical protein
MEYYQKTLQSRPWPQSAVPQDSSTFFHPRSHDLPKDDECRKMFATAYEAILGPLAQLPSLSSIAYAGRCDRPGWCAPSATTIKDHAATSRCLQSNNLENGDPDDSGRGPRDKPLYVSSWSDTEIFTGTMVRLAGLLRSISFDQPLSRCDAIRSELLGPTLFRGNDYIHWRALKDVVRNVIRCTITIPGEGRSLSYMLQLLENMSSLEELKIQIHTETEEDLQAYVAGVTRAHAGEHWKRLHLHCYSSGRPVFRYAPRLRKLFIIGQSSYPELLGESEIIGLLRHHRNSLQEVRIGNIMLEDRVEQLQTPPVSFVPHTLVGLKRGMISLRNCLNNDLSARVAEVQIPRLTCAAGCTAGKPLPGQMIGPHKWECFKYKRLSLINGDISPYDHGVCWVPADFYDLTMESLAMPLDQDGWWRWTIRNSTDDEEGNEN